MHVLIHSSEGSRSHIKFILEISEILLQRGHNVTYVASQEKLKYAKGYAVNTHSLGSFGVRDPNYLRRLQHLGKSSQGMVYILNNLFLSHYERILEGLEAYLDHHPCDVMVCDFAAGACSDLAQERGIPLLIGLQAIDMFGFLQVPYITKTMKFGPVTTRDLSFVERFVYQVVEPIRMMRFMVPLQPPKPTILGDFSYGLGLANTYIGFEPAMPIPPNIRLVGPILSSAPAKLDNRTTAFLDTHERTLYISTGTNIVLEETTFATILNATSDRWRNLGTPTSHLSNFTFDKDLSSHLLVTEWAPQQSVLAHQNTRLHLSHCGLESTFESILTSTPVIAMPFYGDQPRNAAKLSELGIARHANPLTTETILLSIHHLLNSPNVQSHLHQAQQLAKLGYRRKVLAADIIQDHVALAKRCRPHQPYHSHQNLPPCEMRHLVPFNPTKTLPELWDVGWVLTVLTIVVTLLLTRIQRSPLPTLPVTFTNTFIKGTCESELKKKSR
ncbi:hypothetical protein L0F63_000251, partial [Massospora cicadina]